LHLLNFYGDYTQTRVVDSMDSLTQKFSDLNVKKSTVLNFLKTECNLSFKKADKGCFSHCIRCCLGKVCFFYVPS
ncbi:hypothetical protein BDF21DRAFT_348787, partial [Thamnidium elegans]